jgi:hypothetical protein
MSITLPTNFHEKMKLTLSHYIGELHDMGIIEEGQEKYKLEVTNEPFEIYILYILFDDTMPKYHKVKLFNRIANNYFNEEDKNELQNYYIDCVLNSGYGRTKRDPWLKFTNLFVFARMFAKTNKSFIIEQVEGPSCDLILK